jgi:hypothetical protein
VQSTGLEGLFFLNKLHPASPNPESVTRAIIRAFAEDRPIAHAVKASGLSKRQVIYLYGRLRERIADHADELIAKHRASEHWARAREAYRDTAQKFVAAKRAKLTHSSNRFAVRVKTRIDPADEQLIRAREEIHANPEEFREAVEAEITKFLQGAEGLYRFVRRLVRRGFSGRARQLHDREAAYRYSLLMMKNASWKWNEIPTQRAFADGTRDYTYSKNVLEVLFRRGHTIGREVENDLIRLLEKEPL